MFSLHLREDICYWKCTCSHQPQALWTILFKNSVVLFNEFRWSYVFDELHYSPISKKVKKKIVLIFVHCQNVDSRHILKEDRACLKNHSSNLHASIYAIFCLHSVAVACYAALIQAKSPANCYAHLAENIFQTRSRKTCHNIL